MFVGCSAPLVSKLWKLQHAYIGKPVSKDNALQKALRKIKGDQGGVKAALCIHMLTAVQ